VIVRKEKEMNIKTFAVTTIMAAAIMTAALNYSEYNYKIFEKGESWIGTTTGNKQYSLNTACIDSDDPKATEKIIEESAYVPAWVLKKWNDDGGRIIVHDGDTLDAEQKLSSYALMYVKTQGMAPIGNYEMESGNINLTSSLPHLQNSFVHEMGHYMDRSYGWASYDGAFIRIWEKERDAYSDNFNNSDYIYNDNSEYFAEAFMTYCHFPLLLKETCPDTYKYIDKLAR